MTYEEYLASKVQISPAFGIPIHGTPNPKLKLHQRACVEWLVRRGRARGIGVTMITQRPQVLSKDVLTQADVLITLRLGHPKDIDAIEEWVNVHADPREAKSMVDSLADLPTGTAWVWAPMLKIFEAGDPRRPSYQEAKMFPAPANRDYRSPNAKPYSARGGGKKGEQLPNVIGGQLNPTWVEWLMGYPRGWTALKASAMPSSRRSPK